MKTTSSAQLREDGREVTRLDRMLTLKQVLSKLS
jgi:hypothetical protein